MRHKNDKRIRIGISANFFYPDKTRKAYPPKTVMFGEESLYRWIEQGGAIPYMIPRLSGVLSMRDIVNDLDGIVLSGGADISPKSYGEEPLKPEWAGDYDRDQYEIELVHTAIEAQKPVLGICRGHQLMNVALGGTMYQDIAIQKEGAICHRDAEIYDTLSHDVRLEPDSVLAEIFSGQAEGHINSIHHQAIKDLGKNLSVQARSIPDDIIEAIWLEKDSHYALGIQWHPEWINNSGFLESAKIRDHFFANIL